MAISPFKFHSFEVKLGLYADDLLLYTSNPQEAISSLMRKTEVFGYISGYIVIPEKTEIMDWNQEVASRGGRIL